MGRKLNSQAGLTLIEVLVATTMLLVGVMGAAQLVSSANGHTMDARGRASATGIARRVVEAARAIPPSELSRATLAAKLQASAPDLADASPADPRWTIVQKGYTYVIGVDVCTIDDPGDGVGAGGSHTNDFCSAPAATAQVDQAPADYRRMNIELTWSPGGRNSAVRQSVELTSGTGRAPAVSALKMTAPADCSETCPVITAGTSATFAATTSATPASITWLVNGAPAVRCPAAATACSGSGTSWSYIWNLGTPALHTGGSNPNAGKCMTGQYVYDGVHEVGVRAADEAELAGPYSSMTVSLNRCAPLAPESANATGRDRTLPVVDVEWNESLEGDVVGYRVYRATSLTGTRTPICPAAPGDVIPTGKARSCVDTAPPAYSGQALYYIVVAVDRDTAGALREGSVSAINVNSGNRAPGIPTSLTASATTGVRLTWTLPATLDPDSGDTIDSFRIYRRDGSTAGAPTLADRYDRDSSKALCSGTTCSYVDTAPNGTAHTYWVTAVDTHLRESDPTAGVVR